MRALITGGAGYIGSHTARRLAEQGHEPVAFDNLSTGHRWNVRWGPLVEGDLRDAPLLRRTLHEQRIEAVIHFAARAYVGESMRDPRGYFANNVGGSLALLDAMLDEGVTRIVFSSTCATYGVPDAVPIAEEQPQRPVNPYGESKLFVERALRWYEAAYGLRWVALRYFNVAGAEPEHGLGEEHDPETHIVPLAIQAALGKRPQLELFGSDYPTADGSAVRDYIHVADLAEAHIAALRYLQVGGAGLALNLGSGDGCSVRDVIGAVEAISGRRVPLRVSARRPGDPPVLVADPRRAESVLGWRAERSDLPTIVESAWRWHTRE